MPSPILISSSGEPTTIKNLGETSSVPESFGCDIYFEVGDEPSVQKVGFQRKEVRDFANSTRNGIFGKELAKMQHLDTAVVIVEGDWQWNANGESLRATGFTQEQFLGMSYSILSRGYWIVYTHNLAMTCQSVLRLRTRLENPKDTSLLSRPKPFSYWGNVSDRQWAAFLLQSFDGIGPKQAGRILDHFDGKLPIAWTCDLAELAMIPGIGPERATSLWRTLQHVEKEEGTESGTESEEPYYLEITATTD